MSVSGRTVHFISRNDKDLNNTTKAKNLIAHLLFFYNTNLHTSEISRIKRPWMGQFLHSRFSERARGTAFIVHRDIAFKPSTDISDSNGRYVIVLGKLQTKPVVLLSIYAPTWDDEKCIGTLFTAIPTLNDHHIILSGDFNQAQDTELDRSSSTRPADLNQLMH